MCPVFLGLFGLLMLLSSGIQSLNAFNVFLLYSCITFIFVLENPPVGFLPEFSIILVVLFFDSRNFPVVTPDMLSLPLMYLIKKTEDNSHQYLGN